jgi:endogenous inhibitor of DNA gyrase (YacG/DUF329 family)
MICPTCKRSFDRDRNRQDGEPTSPSGPFCSTRCRLADLGHWLDGNYRIGSPISEEDLDGSPVADGDDETPGSGN